MADPAQTADRFVAPTGDQYAVEADGFAAVVTEVGATLRSLTLAGRDLIRPFDADGVPSGGQGQQLVPWPNRIRDGRYTFDGVSQQLPLSEPGRHNASHGLARHVPWRLVEHTADTVVQTVRVFRQPGWPGVLDVQLTHRVGADGLVVEVSATAVGADAVPFGYAAHPYLVAGEQQVDQLHLEVPAGRFVEVDERLLPTAVVDVSGTLNDLREGRTVGELSLDTAFTDLSRGGDQRWRVTIGQGDRSTTLWADPGLDWVQVFTGGPYRTWGIAVEPMSCGADAFNEGPTHDALIVLQPGDTRSFRWGITGR